MRRRFLSALLAAARRGIPLALTCATALYAQSSYKVIEVKDGGMIRGIVRLAPGTAVPQAMLVTKDMKCCGASKKSPRLVLGRNHGVENSIVYLDGIVEGKPPQSDVRVTLEQKNCEYQPHVLIVPMGAQLQIMNGDPILHNVHAYRVGSDQQSLFNIAQPVKGQKTQCKSSMTTAPGLIATMCDAGHPWMSGYVKVAETPYCVLTDKEGNFVLDKVPPGKYSVCVWHEGVSVTRKEMEEGKVKKYFYEEPYEMRKEVVVSPSATVTVDFDLQLRPSAGEGVGS